MDGDIRSLADDVDHYRRMVRNESIPPAVREWATDEVAAIAADLDAVLADREETEADLLDFIQQEADRDDRDEPVCTCDDLGCPLKLGQLARPIRTADSLTRGLRTWKQEHAGHPVVLDDYRERRRERRARCRYVIENVLIHLHPDREEVPDRSGLADRYEQQAATAAGD